MADRQVPGTPFADRTAWARDLRTSLREFPNAEPGGAVVRPAAAAAALVRVNVRPSSCVAVWERRADVRREALARQPGNGPRDRTSRRRSLPSGPGNRSATGLSRLTSIEPSPEATAVPPRPTISDIDASGCLHDAGTRNREALSGGRAGDSAGFGYAFEGADLRRVSVRQNRGVFTRIS